MGSCECDDAQHESWSGREDEEYNEELTKTPKKGTGMGKRSAPSEPAKRGEEDEQQTARGNGQRRKSKPKERAIDGEEDKKDKPRKRGRQPKSSRSEPPTDGEAKQATPSEPATDDVEDVGEGRTNKEAAKEEWQGQEIHTKGGRIR